MCIDQKTEKYNRFSPYNYCLNNPINRIDIDGKDIIIMLAPGGANGEGHSAILIGNDKTGWVLYSKNGTYEHSGLWGPSDKGRRENGNYTFLTLHQFATSVHNRNLEDGTPEYTSAYRITSGNGIDNLMKKAASKQVAKYYKLIGASCIDVASDALRAGGFYDGGINPVPNARYDNIVKKNKGKDVSEELDIESPASWDYDDDKSNDQTANNNASNSDNSSQDTQNVSGSQQCTYEQVMKDLKNW